MRPDVIELGFQADTLSQDSDSVLQTVLALVSAAIVVLGTYVVCLYFGAA